MFDIIRVSDTQYRVAGVILLRDAPGLWACRPVSDPAGRPMFTAPTLEAMFDMVDGARQMMAPA
jgi:hypothetical protein